MIKLDWRDSDWARSQAEMLKPKIKWCFVALASLLLWGCQDLPQQNPRAREATPIQSLQKFPTERNLKPVILQGRVIRQAPFLKGGAYLLQDETGQIWVVTQRVLPKTGDEIRLQGGQEYRQIPLGKRETEEVYVQELERLSARD